MTQRFQNRTEAGEALADALARRAWPDPVVLALPRGGVPVALPIARRLGAPLDLIFVRKIGVPGQPELAAGAVVDGTPPQAVWNPNILRAFDLDEADLAPQIETELARIAARRQLYLRGRAPLPLGGRTAIVVDDGVATGATVRAALKALSAMAPTRIVLALPVAPADTLSELRALADEVICLATPEPFIAVGAHYLRFDQVSDDTVAAIMAAERDPNGKEDA